MVRSMCCPSRTLSELIVTPFSRDLGDFIGCMTGPEVFTERLCGEIGLDAAEYERILASIRQQLQSSGATTKTVEAV